jgi:hypothetical protein
LQFEQRIFLGAPGSGPKDQYQIPVNNVIAGQNG